MANFDYLISENDLFSKENGNILIRFTHHKGTIYIPTDIFVTKKDVTQELKLCNNVIKKKVSDLIHIYRQRLLDYYCDNYQISMDVIEKILNEQTRKQINLDFVAFARKWCKIHGRSVKGIKNYYSAINALCNAFGKQRIMCNEINLKTMNLFEESLSIHPRAKTLYTSAIKHLFDKAREYYNDEENGIIRIKNTLCHYKPPRQRITRKRALTKEVIRKIYKLRYNNLLCRNQISRHDLAKDCFIMSFCLCGINSADLYNATQLEGNCIIYQRTKTKDRRDDCAEMKIHIPKILEPLVAKYRGKDRVFNFYERFGSFESLNRAINVGLKEIGREINIKSLQYYSARHSMATIAINQVGIDKFTVAEMLNHTVPSMKITDIYIEKDFSRINAANDKLIKYVFG